MKALAGVISGLGVFFLLLNTFGGIVSGLWLAVIGEWWAIVLGLAGLVISHWILSLALLPSIAIGAGAVYFAGRSKLAFLLFGLLSNLYLLTVMTVWCGGILAIFMSRATPSSWIPLLIWSYGAAIGPWAYMATKEAQGGDGDGAMTATFFAQVGYLAMIIVGVLVGATYITLMKVFAGVMAIHLVIQLSTMYLLADEAMLQASRNADEA